MPRRLALALALLVVIAVAWLAAPALQAAQPQFWKIEGARDFLEGEVTGLSVDSEGLVRLAPASHVLHDPEVPNVWCVTADPKGVLYVGTGNDGKVFKVENGKGSVLFDAPELEVHALAVGPDGRLYVATSPDGKVYAIDAAGHSTTFFEPGQKYIWALAFDKAGNLFVATGAEGRIFRVDPKGKGQVVLTSPETHLLSMVIDEKGNLYAGSAPEGIVYRLDPALKVFVVLDTAFREIKALEMGTDGSLYVAAVDTKGKDEAPPRPLPAAATPAAAPVAEVTVTESFTMALPPVGSPGFGAPSSGSASGGSAKGAVLRIAPTGEIDTLWSSPDETPHTLTRAGDRLLLGTGNKGKVYQVRDDRTWTMVTTFAAEQVTSLFRRPGGGVLVATSNPGKLHALDSAPGATGVFTSKVKDAETVSRWGRLRWDADLPAGTELQVQTRAGNTANPDSTWTDWSSPYPHRDGDAVTSERARFLQLKATLVGKAGASPVLDTLTTAYLPRNLRPIVQSITVHAPGEVFQKPISISGETEILGLDTTTAPDRGAAAAARAQMPSATSYSRKLFQHGLQTFSWKAEDPNADTLIYDVSYRAVGDTRFRLLRKGLTEAVLAWDTTTVPNGRYVIRVSASDSPSNPGALALTGDKESVPFEVDNTPPSVIATLTQRSPARVHVVAKDDSSLIRRTEYSVDGGRWEEVHPLDGINDSREESYDIALDALSGAGPHIVVVRSSDSLGNVSTARVEVP